MAAGRDGRAERVWRERLGRQRRSGLSVVEFCQREGVSTASFYGWKRRLRQGDGRGPGRSESNGTDRRGNGRPPAPLFVPVAVTAASVEVRIELPGGALVRIPAAADEGLLRRCFRAAVTCLAEREAQ